MGKKTVQVKQVLADIRAGMHDNALMQKYELSPGQLKSLMKKLEDAGLVKKPVEELAPEKPSYYDTFFTCPACGLNEPGDFEECPRCGVVAAKYRPSEKTGALQSPEKKTDKAMKFDTWNQSMPRSYRGLKILAAVIVIAAVAVAVFMVNQYLEKERNAFHPSDREQTDVQLDEDNPSGTIPPQYKDLIKRKLPNVAPLNPELDSHMRDSMEGIGDALDRRNRARKDLIDRQ